MVFWCDLVYDLIRGPVKETNKMSQGGDHPENHGISSHWWFGDPRPLRKTHPNPSKSQGPVIVRETIKDSLNSLCVFVSMLRFNFCIDSTLPTILAHADSSYQIRLSGPRDPVINGV